jgi:uncharacterized protein (DUF488 family)
MLTLGHGRLDRDELAALLGGAGVEALVDVRRYPGSRHNSAAAQGEIERMATDAGIHYRHDPRLGGRRHLAAADDAASPDTWWRVAAFRAYAGWTRTDEFRAAMGELATQAGARRTAVLCSEAVWWRCHRRIIADVAMLVHGMPVEHLMHDGRLVAHASSEGARLTGDGDVVWDG